MRQNIKNFVKLASLSLPVMEPIFEFGSLLVPGQEEFADLRPIFQGRDYVGCDMREGPGVDRILNLHEIDLSDESAGMVLCLDTLEHVEYPHQAMKELHRILKPDGIVVISSVMDFPIHDYPNDFWRFTPEAFKSILKPFADSFVGFQGNPRFPHTVVGLGFKGKMPSMLEFNQQFAGWQKIDRRSPGQIIASLTPPILLPLVIKAYETMIELTRRPRINR